MTSKNIPTNKCLECGVMFFKKSSESRKYWRTKKYCSYKCSLIHTAVQKQDFDKDLLKGHIPWNKNTKGIMKPNSGSFQKGSKINLGRIRLDMRGENNPTWKPKTIKSCSHCQKELSLAPNQVRDRNFCNRSCWALGTRGNGSPVYRGDESVGRLRGRIAELPEYKTWHATCLKNGNYLCFKCGSKKQLEVDHIKRFFLIVVENGIITPSDARNCKELWDVSNGRVICRPCHRTLDTYGTTGLKKTKTNKINVTRN